MNMVIRADASTQIGMGHLMRCLALAQAWRESGGTAHFICADIPPPLKTRLQNEGMLLTCLDVAAGTENDMTRTIAFAQKIKADWVVLDGYQFGRAFQEAIKQADFRLFCIDDYGHASHYYADVVLNQNISADESLYKSREPYTRLKLGTQFVFLRREFLPWRSWKRTTPEVSRRILVTMGGSDPDNVTMQVINTLITLNNSRLEVQIIVGPGNPHVTALERKLSYAPCSMQLMKDPQNVASLMASADLAVSAEEARVGSWHSWVCQVALLFYQIIKIRLPELCTRRV